MSMSFRSTPGTSAFRTNSFSVSTISTAGAHGRVLTPSSLNRRLILSWKSLRPVGKSSVSANGAYLTIGISGNLHLSNCTTNIKYEHYNVNSSDDEKYLRGFVTTTEKVRYTV